MARRRAAAAGLLDRAVALGAGFRHRGGTRLVEPRGNAGHRRVAARHFLDNPASGRVLAKLGFRSTGEICPGASLARDGVAPTLGYALDLDPPGNCDRDRRIAA
jgi:hypothetical protein